MLIPFPSGKGFSRAIIYLKWFVGMGRFSRVIIYLKSFVGMGPFSRIIIQFEMVLRDGALAIKIISY